MIFQVNPRQRIHMQNQALFSSKDKSKKLNCLLLQFLFCALRVNFFEKDTKRLGTRKCELRIHSLSRSS